MATKIFPLLVRRLRYTSIGSYPLVYRIKVWSWHKLEEHRCVCATCVEKYDRALHWNGGLVADNDLVVDEIEGDVHWEGEPITCYDCGDEIESAYGVPEIGDRYD